MTRREALRLLSLAGAMAGLGAACQSALPPSPDLTPAQAAASPTASPTAAPTAATTNPLFSLFSSTPTPPSAIFRIGVDMDPDTLDPVGQTSARAQNIADYMVEPLVRQLADGRIVPAVADRWSVSPDGATYQFHLRAHVSFHDGSPMTADAVKGSLERFLNPQLKVPLRAPLGGGLIQGIEVLDDRNVRIQLRYPFRLLLPKLASTELGIVSPAHVSKFPESYNDQPVGTGPYRFEARVAGESVTVKRYDGYWGPRPFYPQVQFRIVPEATTRESLLLANQVEMITLPPMADLPSLESNGAVKVLRAPTSRSVFIGMDLTLPGGTPLSIKKARQALNFAVDRDTIIRTVLFGAASPMDGAVAPSLVGYSRTGPYGYDPGRARQLLLEGGTPALALRLLHSTGHDFEDAQASQVAQAVAGNLRDVGVSVDLVGYDWPSLVAAINVPEDKGVAHMHLFWWSPRFLDVSQQLPLFSGSQWPPAGLNTCHYANRRVDDLLAQATAQPDPSRRNDLYAEVQRIVWDDAPWVFLWVPSFPIVHSKRVKSIASLPTEKFDAIYAEPS